jgi:hypothetical protein
MTEGLILLAIVNCKELLVLPGPYKKQGIFFGRHIPDNVFTLIYKYYISQNEHLSEKHTPIRPKAYFCLPTSRWIGSFGSCVGLLLIGGVTEGSGEEDTELQGIHIRSRTSGSQCLVGVRLPAGLNAC